MADCNKAKEQASEISEEVKNQENLIEEKIWTNLQLLHTAAS